jgi:hypothetical protein
LKKTENDGGKTEFQKELFQIVSRFWYLFAFGGSLFCLPLRVQL